MCDFKALKERAPDEVNERRLLMGTPSCESKDYRDEMESTKDCNAREPDGEPDLDGDGDAMAERGARMRKTNQTLPPSSGDGDGGGARLRSSGRGASEGPAPRGMGGGRATRITLLDPLF